MPKAKERQTTGAKQSRWYNIAILILFIYETVVVTLAGTYLAPVDNLGCGLDTRWLDLFRKHNGKAIRRIQDAFKCCGLHSTVDKAYPFPGKDVGVDACKKAFSRSSSCFVPWREEERKIASLILMTVVLVAIWKVKQWKYSCEVSTNIMCRQSSSLCPHHLNLGPELIRKTLRTRRMVRGHLIIRPVKGDTLIILLLKKQMPLEMARVELLVCLLKIADAVL
jgi:hypothetical protein